MSNNTDDTDAGDDFIVTPSGPPTTSLSTIRSSNKKDVLNILEESFDDYSDIELTEEESTKLQKTLKRLSTGSSSFILLNCHGAACPFASKCPLVKMQGPRGTPHGKAPVGKDCLLEASMLRDAASSYLLEYEVDINSYTEVNIVTELAELEVLLWRINMQLGMEGNSLLVKDQIIGFDRGTHEAITQQQVSPLFEQKLKLSTRKSKLIKLMVGDRQEKYKKEAALKRKPDNDASSQMSDVKKQLQQLQNKLLLNNNSEKVVSPEDFIMAEEK